LLVLCWDFAGLLLSAAVVFHQHQQNTSTSIPAEMEPLVMEFTQIYQLEDETSLNVFTEKNLKKSIF